MKPCDFVLFGTLGDLARRKLLPSLYQLEKAELIAPETTIVGVARGESTDEQYIALARESLEKFMKEPIEAGLGTFRPTAALCEYRPHAIGPVQPPSGQGGSGTTGDGQLLCRGAQPVRRDLPGAFSCRACHGTGQGGAGKAYRHGPRLIQGHQRCSGGLLPRRAGVPYRPLSWQGDGAESPGAALCQLHFHHQLGPQHHRSRPDHRG